MVEEVRVLKGKIEVDHSQVKRGFAAAQATISRGISSLGVSFAAVGTKIAAVGAGVVATVSSIGVAVTKMASDFEQQMSEVRTLMAGISDTEFRKFEDGILSLSRKVGKGTAELSKGLYQVVSAGVDSADQLKVLEAAAKAGAAGLSTTEDAVNLTSAVVKGYGLDWKEAETVLDQAFQTVKLGQTRFDELASKMGLVVPIASKMGVSLEELNGAYATLTGVTGSTAEVTTQLRAIFSSFLRIQSKVGKQVEKLWEERQKALKKGETARVNAIDAEIKKLKDLHRAMDPAQIKANGLATTLDTLTKAAGGNEAKLLDLVGQVEALPAIFALTGAQADNFRKKTEAMGRSAGEMEKAYAEIAKTFRFQWDQLKAELQTLGIEIGRTLLPKVKEIFKSVRGWLKENREEIKEVVQGLIQGVVKLFEGMGAAMKAAWPHIEKAIKWLSEGMKYLPEMIDEAKKALEQFGIDIENAFERAAMHGSTLVKALKQEMYALASVPLKSPLVQKALGLSLPKSLQPYVGQVLGNAYGKPGESIGEWMQGAETREMDRLQRIWREGMSGLSPGTLEMLQGSPAAAAAGAGSTRTLNDHRSVTMNVTTPQDAEELARQVEGRLGRRALMEGGL